MTKRIYRRRTDPDFEAFNQRLAERIRTLRVEQNMDQDDFARNANLHRTHMSQLENAKTDPTLSTVFKVAKALGISVSELLDFGAA